MSEIDVRTVVIATYLLRLQEAIPWCTFHKRSVVFPESGLCADGPVGCMISTGGPDHKWWRDEA